jgi:hypothetical protein
MTVYDRDELGKVVLTDGWRGDDFAMFRYKPARWGGNAATELVLDFKRNEPAARDEVLAWCLGTIRNLERDLRTSRQARYVVCIPRSAADTPNEPCEWLAAQLASELGWLEHLPYALRRTTAITPAHKAAQRPTAEEQKQTIRYAGPVLQAAPKVIEGLYCHACRKQFGGTNGLNWHIANNRDHHRAVAAVPPAGDPPGVLLLDDVITRGATSTACRELLLEAGAGTVTGFFVARTG